MIGYNRHSMQREYVMRTKILVIEDDSSISELICMNLEAAGYRALPIMDGLEAERFVRNMAGGKGKSGEAAGAPPDEPALALVDVMLPGKDGFELMKDFQAAGIPVIYLTAKDDVFSKVHGLKSGAEDYIVKPFEAMELLARIEVILRRVRRIERVYHYGNIAVNVEEHTCKCDGEEVYLTPKEFDVLIFFIQHKDVAISRERLLAAVWGFEYEGESRTIDIHIQQLRKKLNLKDKLVTIPKLGYRLESAKE